MDRRGNRTRSREGAVVALLFALALSGCSFLSGTNKTISTLQHAGYRDVGVHLESGSGLPPDGLVDISYSAGPTSNTEVDAFNAARIVWNTLRYRFGALVITKTSGGCAGAFCVSRSNEIGGETYAEMRAQFGPRPAVLDKTPASRAVRIPVWVPIVIVAAVLGVVITVVVTLIRKRRRPRGGPWVPPASGGGNWTPSSAQWVPPTQP